MQDGTDISEMKGGGNSLPGPEFLKRILTRQVVATGFITWHKIKTCHDEIY